jgi:hypothetical protein
VPLPLIKKHRLWRLFEIIPGAITWLALALPVILSFFWPKLVASFIIVYTIVWLFRSVKLSINLYKSYNLTKLSLKTDWTKMISYNDHLEKIDYEIKKTDQRENPKKYLKLFYAKKQIQYLQQTGQHKKSKDIWHAIIFVTYKESYELIRESIKSYANSEYPASRMMLVLGGEEADRDNFLQVAEKIKKEFGSKFGHFMTTVHPKNLPGEIKGKSANATWAGKELKKYIDQMNSGLTAARGLTAAAPRINYDDIIISNFDADTVTHPLYFSELTYKYLTTDVRTEKGYQPTHMFHNNIWDVPMMIRMVALSCTFWRMAESMEKDKYKSFSSRSLSFKTVIDVDYWDTSVIPEDSRQFWSAYIIYDGRHTLVPIYSPVYMDAVLSDTYIKTFKSQYAQLRRWAWGVCDFPFVALNLWYHPKLKLSTKIYQITDFLKNSFFWATSPILLTFTGFIPGLVNIPFRETVLAYNLPLIMSNLLTFSSTGIIVCAIISLNLIPYNPKKGWKGQISLMLQWLLIPIVSLFLSAVPALDAQTRLMFGKYLEYKVTQKSRPPSDRK